MGLQGCGPLRSAFGGNGGDTPSSRCRQHPVSLGRAVPNVVSSAWDAAGMRLIRGPDLPGGIWRGVPGCGFASPPRKAMRNLPPQSSAASELPGGCLFLSLKGEHVFLFYPATSAAACWGF